MHIPGTSAGSERRDTGRGLRRVSSRIAGTRVRRRPGAGPSTETATAPTANRTSATISAVASAPTTSRRPAAVRPDPVLRWKNPSHPPAGAFTPTAVPNAHLTDQRIPRHGDGWDVVSSFSLSYDGYAYWDDVAELAARSVRGWTRDHAMPGTIDEIRGCLFYEQRRWHHFGEEPVGRGADYVWALVDALRVLVAARTAAEPSRSPSPASAPVGPVPNGITATVADPSRRPRPEAVVRSFLDDDPGYLAWAGAHADGFVINADRTLSPNSLMLHRARCSCIGGPAASGRTRTANYRKVCGSDIDDLVDWCRRDIGVDPARCRHCRPPS